MYSTYVLQFYVDWNLWRKKKKRRKRKQVQQRSELLANMAWNTCVCLSQSCSVSTVGKRYSQISCWGKECKAYLILHDATIDWSCNYNRFLSEVVESPASRYTKLSWTSSWVTCCKWLCFKQLWLPGQSPEVPADLSYSVIP